MNVFTKLAGLVKIGSLGKAGKSGSSGGSAQNALPPEKIPAHVAFVLDGNGRWATARSLPRTAGHKAGAERFEAITEYCHDLGVQTITAYAFSTENWKRSKEEIDGIIALLDTYLDDLIEIKYKKNIRLRVLGDNSPFPDYIREKIRVAEEKTAPNRYNLNLCLNYGGRAEICHAFNTLAARGFTQVTEEDIASALYTAPTGDPDIIIRTGGDSRLSNFLLWQASYAELYFTPTLWPDFSNEELYAIFEKFSKTKRRYGGYNTPAVK